MAVWRPDPARWAALFEGIPTPLVLGHRGFGKGRVPAENTAAAFEAALVAGVDGLEADVILSRDGVPIVAHGPTAAAAGLPDVRIDSLTLSELRALNFAEQVGGPSGRIMTAGEFLESYSGRALLNIELKLWRFFNGQLEQALCSLIRPYLKRGERVFCSSFNPFSLRRMRALLPELCLAMLWRDDLLWFARNRSLFWFVQPDFLQPFEGRVDDELLRFAAERGYRVHAWTVDSEERFRELVALGIPLVFTDEVTAAVRWRDRLRAEYGRRKSAGG